MTDETKKLIIRAEEVVHEEETRQECLRLVEEALKPISIKTSNLGYGIDVKLYKL